MINQSYTYVKSWRGTRDRKSQTYIILVLIWLANVLTDLYRMRFGREMNILVIIISPLVKTTIHVTLKL